jgi:hypothetical protein
MYLVKKRGLIALLVSGSFLFYDANLLRGGGIVPHFERAVRDIKYASEPYAEIQNDYWQTPEETEKSKTGDDEDKAFYLCDKLVKEGYKADVFFGLRHVLDRDFSSWVEMNINGMHYILDPVKGLIQKRESLSDYKATTTYIPALGNPNIKKKYDEFKKRANLDYEPMRHYSDSFYNGMERDIDNNLEFSEVKAK